MNWLKCVVSEESCNELALVYLSSNRNVSFEVS